MNTADAARIGVCGGGRARITTRRGSAEVDVEVPDRMQPGHVSLPNGLGLDYPDLGRVGGRAEPAHQLLTQIDGRMPVTTVDNVAKKSAFVPEMMRDLMLALTEFDRNDELWVAVLCAAGETRPPGSTCRSSSAPARPGSRHSHPEAGDRGRHRALPLPDPHRLGQRDVPPDGL